MTSYPQIIAIETVCLNSRSCYCIYKFITPTTPVKSKRMANVTVKRIVHGRTSAQYEHCLNKHRSSFLDPGEHRAIVEAVRSILIGYRI